MLKKIIKRILPDYDTLKQQKILSGFGHLLNDANLWHINRRSACGAFGIGLFFAFWPVPFQMWLAAALAIPLRVNLPLSVATVWITNPITMPAIFYGAYVVGSTVMGTDSSEFQFQLTWEWLYQSFETVGPAFVLGCAICATVFGIVGYLGLSFVWRLSVQQAWYKRSEKRHRHRQQ